MTKMITLFTLCLFTAQITFAQQFYPGVDDKSLVSHVLMSCLQSEDTNSTQDLCKTVRKSIDEKLPSGDIWSEDFYAAINATIDDLYKNCFPEMKSETCQKLKEAIIKSTALLRSIENK